MNKPTLPMADTPATLKHFSQDGPIVRLTALFICKLPLILPSALAVCWLFFGVGRYLGKW